MVSDQHITYSDLGHVGGPGLDTVPGLGRGALHSDQDLKLAVSDVPGRVGVEGRGGVYPVTHYQRPEGLDDVAAAVKITAKLHRGEMIGDDLTLGCPPLAQEVTEHHAADQLVLPEVAEPELEVEL